MGMHLEGTARGLVAAAALAFAMVTPSPALAAPSAESFFTGAGTTADGPATTVNDTSVEAGGLQYGLYYTDDSGETSNFASADDLDVSKINRSIIDADNYKNLELVLEVYNGSDAEQTVSGSLSIPLDRYTGRSDAEARLVATDGVYAGTTDAASNVRLQFNGGNGVNSGLVSIFDAVDAYTAAGGTWADLRSVGITGTVAPGAHLSVHIPLTVTNMSDAILYGSDYANARYRNNAVQFAGRDGASTRYISLGVRFARQVTYTDAEGAVHGLFESTGKYLAGTRDTQTAYNYTQVPAGIQALLPNISKGDIYLDNILYMNRHAATVNDVLYTGGVYRINLDRVKAAVRDSGYSVAPGSSERGLYLDIPGWYWGADEDLTDDLYGEYSYLTTGDAKIVSNTGDGTQVALNGEDASGNEIGSLYLELRPVISTRDLELSVGDAWTAADSLVSMVDHAGAAVDVSDTAHVRVVDNVDTSKPGVYQVRYYYYYRGDAAAAGDDYEASLTAKVTVKAPVEPAQPEQPTTPDAPAAADTTPTSAPKRTVKRPVRAAALPQTGDYVLAGVGILVGLAAVAVIAALVLKRRKK